MVLAADRITRRRRAAKFPQKRQCRRAQRQVNAYGFLIRLDVKGTRGRLRV